MKANNVYALLRLPASGLILVSEFEDGTWGVAYGLVGEDEIEAEAIERILPIDVGLDIEAVEQIGPLYQLPGGGTARAFDCKPVAGQDIPSDTFVGHRWIRNDELPALTFKDDFVLQMVLDGFVVMDGELAIVTDKTEAPEDMLPIEGIWHEVIDGEEMLVEEKLDEEGRPMRRVWKRLFPADFGK